MPHIQQLDSHVADLIAAGEVVERPASVVKELVENAIDAGSSAVVVEIRRGGMGLIRVTDNGCGIAPAELPTAFLRHATSKLRTEEDLGRIGTLGFRGEALAAISAVSSWDLMKRPLTKNTCMDREPRPWRGPVTKPDTATSPPRPSTGTKPWANSRPRAAYTADSNRPSPGVWRASTPSLMNLKEMSGWDRARCCINPPTAAVSALSLRMNFSRAGVL